MEIEGLVDQMNLRLSLLGSSHKKACEDVEDLKVVFCYVTWRRLILNGPSNPHSNEGGGDDCMHTSTSRVSNKALRTVQLERKQRVVLL